MYSVLSLCTLFLSLTVLLPVNSQLTSWNYETNTASTRLGAKLARCDVNNDSYMDLVSTGSTAVYVFYGTASGTYDSTPNAVRTIIPLPGITTDGLGLDCADLNADGFADVIVGNWTGSPTQYVHIFNGSSAGVAATPASITWTGTGHYFGSAITTADFNGDGKRDLAVGAYGLGRVLIYYGLGSNGINPTASTQSQLFPNVLTYGQNLAACDLSNDGSADLIVGARSMNSSRGQLYIYNNNAGTFQLAHNTIGAAASAFYGFDAQCGDINGDGNKDVAVLSQGDRLLYIYYGTGSVSTLAKPASLVIPLIDSARSISVADHNLDGFADIIVGFNALGRVQVWYGGPTLSASSTYGMLFSAPTNAGWSVLGLTNLDGTGSAEVAYGAYAYTNGQTSEGLVGVFYNPPASPSPSASASSSSTPSNTPSNTPSPTSSVTPTASATPTASVTPSSTATPTATASPTASASASATATASATASATPSSSAEPSPSRSPSRSPSKSPTPSRSASPTASPSSSASASATPTSSASVSASASASSIPSEPLEVSPPPTAQYGSCSQCSSDADCSNGRGVCVSSSIGSYCACLSGFGGCNCQFEPSDSCSSSYVPVTYLAGNFKANATVDYEYPNLFVAVQANLEASIWGNGGSNPSNTAPYSLETRMYFGESPESFPECSYPNGETSWKDLAAGASSCSDVYLSNMTWSFAKDHCGFAAVNGTRNYTQTITIVRRYTVDGELERTEKTTRHLYINFPSEIGVTDSNVNVSFPAANAFAALTSIDYNPDTMLWAITVQSKLSNPYSLGAPVAAQYTGNLGLRAPSVSVSGCTLSASGTACIQTITYLYPQGFVSDPCLGLFGEDLHTFPVLCSTPSCPGPNLVNITLDLGTGNACPLTDDITFSEASLSSYGDSSLNNAKDSFSVLDVAYFGASVQSLEAMISSRALKANSVCFLPPAGSCFYANYTVISSTNGKEPVFKVDLSGPGNAAYFSSITTPTTFSVKATVLVNFEGAKSRNKLVPHSQTVETVATAVIGGSSSSSSAISPALLLIVLLLAALNM